MALIKTYETKSGIELPNAYHIVHKVDTYKRVVDDEDPYGARPADAPNHIWKAGYYGRISIAIYSSKEARESGKSPVATRVVYPTDIPNASFTGEVNLDSLLNFDIDITSTKSIIEQAYDYLLTIDEYKESISD